ncbi:hypothetical protein NQ317_016133 [Molorchus minor]|uniref:GPI ethanolamine phosphate transferase 2 C-terminal domain-containing protein n=1 Tax=Molorchus minor TaxID=1323400 RepID=A0ABQ9J8P7_9CUCU|nr:hypothetical protein NQ317_016133 [Molorchus minor]
MFAYYFLVVLSVLLFFYGFFPVSKPSTKWNNNPPTHINDHVLNKNECYSSDIKKTVLLIIDALRLDFKNGCFNKVKVETPTVTLPRIKALVAGNIPQFIDLVLNLATSEVLQDSLIHSAYNQRRKIVYEGTSSFFVRDFTEVDDNVTRNVQLELGNDDWDMMILHYLGLDHIGHVYGPFSSLIPTKLKEMDEIIYKIYSEMLLSKTLLVVTGDHGMRDSGGHGGSTYSETHVPFLMLGHNCSNGSFLQTDVPVNLAVLLGLNIPSTSIGQPRKNLLPFSLEKYLFAFKIQYDVCGNHFDLATKSHEDYIKNGDQMNAFNAIEYYENCSNKISEELIKSSVKQHLGLLIIGILMMFNLFAIFLNKLIANTSKQEKHKPLNPSAKIILFICTFFILAHFWISSVIITFAFGCILVIKFMYEVFYCLTNLKYKIPNEISSFFVISSIIHPLTFFSSSFVEEEHQFWYFFNNLFLLTVDRVICIHKILRTLNSTGDKWANYPDFSDWLLKPENNVYNKIFFISGLCTVFYCQHVLLNRTNKLKTSTLNFVILLLIYVLKNVDHSSIILGKIVWFLILSHTLIVHNFLQTWILILALLLKPYNVILISYCLCASMIYFKQYKNSVTITLCHSWLGHMLYFTQGHSNSLASVDISVGYIGLKEYQPLLVITQILCHTYAFPILCHVLILRNDNIDGCRVWEILFCNRLLIMIIVSIITFIFRHHLFIWSVFAPKLLIETIHTVILFLQFLVYCGKQFKKRDVLSNIGKTPYKKVKILHPCIKFIYRYKTGDPKYPTILLGNKIIIKKIK